MKKKNTFPPLKPKATNGPAKQYNAIVEFITEKKLVVQARHFDEYSELVMQFALVLWEIDPHYHKLQLQEKKFPSVVENTFLDHIKPAKHGHAVKALSSVSIALKIEKLFNYIDIGYWIHMKSLHDMMFSIASRIMSYLDYIAKQNERVKKNHQRNTLLEHSIEDFTVKNINMNISSDITSIDHCKGIKQKLQNVDAFEAFAINELINATNTCSFMNIVKDLVERGLPFQVPNFKVFHFKLPLKGLYQVINFLWKENSDGNQISNNPQRLKLVTEVKEKSQTFYFRNMKKVVKGKLLKLGIVKPHEAEFVIKDLLGDKSASNDKSQRQILECLIAVVACGKDIVIDLRKNNDMKPKIEEFWQVLYKVGNTVINISKVFKQFFSTFFERKVELNFLKAVFLLYCVTMSE